MTEFRSMPMFWEAFFSDTASMEEDAAKAYLFLIGHAWIRGAKLVNDDLALARMARVSPRKWASIRGPVMALWYLDETGCWTQKRMKREFDFVRARVDASRKNGLLGGRPKAPETPPNGDSPTVRLDMFVANPWQNESEKQETVPGKINEINGNDNLETISRLTGTNLSTPTLLKEERKKGNATHSCPKRVRTRVEYSDKFEDFWKQYPTDANMSKKEAYIAWNRLSDEDHDKAIKSCRPFCSYCAAHPTYRPVHANRYLSQGRYEGHAATAVNADKTVFVRIGTPQWTAWDKHYRRTRQQAPPTNKQGNGYYFPSEWPGGDG